MYELKNLFSQIGSKNEYVKIAVFLILVMFILSSVIGKKAFMIIGVIALIFVCLGIAHRLKMIAPDSRKEDNKH